MKYRLYSSEGNSEGLESYLGLFEIGDDGYVRRYLEIRADGTPLRYTEEFHTDEYGFLPKGPVDEVEASKPEYGAFAAVSRTVFEALWANTICCNRQP